mmetsp:Transcript_6642/g.9704  ORF Transcript_6642/g.9704 Transcript_6642/m.9704 type:complete len:178 (-) Transcript_6642:29-562(-)|eukprot:CAMPEP_0195528382 /NCGR_PEP_ID=MMETSP0794_2-20130614/30490_1 /TAXON_ID=515487 /ORGANISM="Stephanopyxis turris, Strain CCMP 815" /LENGTH=177 /DNA_ID=CAMNT_0040659505 /DNA_START=71 /DNA_END=604 /DNA_ORIENTATION=-
MMASRVAKLTALVQIFFHSARNVDAAFGVTCLQGTRARASTALNLDPTIAKMLDDEYYKTTHREDYEEEFHRKNQEFMEQALPQNFDVDESSLAEPVLHRQEVRDRKMARRDPQRYCADRCISTGFCDAFEDFFEFSPEEVLDFCTDCVLSEDEEPCDIPYDAMDKFLERETENMRP